MLVLIMLTSMSPSPWLMLWTFIKSSTSSRQARKVSRKEGPVYIQGAYARTIGKRALFHAVKNLRVEQARILRRCHVQLVEDVKPEPFRTGELEKIKRVVGTFGALGDAKSTAMGETRGLLFAGCLARMMKCDLCSELVRLGLPLM